MQKCKICNSTSFYKEAGYYFCQTCQTQNEDIREEVLETRVDSTTRLRKTKIRQLKSDESGEVTGWTSWELYNFVLIGLINELIELGVPTNIKLTILQLWATYLGKLEVAFISTKKKSMPKLARRYKKRDAEIIYGRMESQKTSRKRKRVGSSANTSAASSGLSECSSSMRELNRSKKLLATADYDRYLQSQASSEGDALSMYSQSALSQSSSVKSSVKERKLQFSSHAKAEARKIKKLSKNVPRSERVKYREKHVSTQYKIGPNVITPMRLWAIIYLALRIHDQPIQLGDMLRYGKEGHLSYYKLDHLIPKEINLTPNDRSFLTQNFEITYKGLRRMVASMAKLLGVCDLVCPDLSSLVARYCDELGLPRGIGVYAEKLMALSPPKMTFDVNKSYIPNYEGRAIAFIIVVLKTLLALDGVTEYQISRIAEKINSHGDITYCDNTLSRKKDECKCYESNIPCIIVHGGAGNFSDNMVIEKMTACKKAAINGYKKLMCGENSVDAVEAALWWLECDEFFNCSYGSVLNEIGKVQMDASIMDGYAFKCGSVAAVSDIEHPIMLAKYVMNNFPNSIFVGDGAKNLAKHADINWLSEGNMVAPIARLIFDKEEKGTLDTMVDDQSILDVELLTNISDTVGCVAYDGFSIAAGTTTGGLNKNVVIERGLSQQKLFSFREWRGYIECRKTILIHAHYPTRMKYSPESNGVDNTFLKFLEFVHSKSDESQRDMKISKHTLSNELIDAMKNHVDSLYTNNLSPQPIEIFPASLTPLHSYFQHLIDHPDYDIPSQARKNFFHTKVGYMTNTELLIDLAMKCGLELEIINSNVHFLEKRVPPFEQPRLPSVAELKEIVNVEDDSKNQHETGAESLNDYLHSKIPCAIKFDVTKKQYFDSIESTIEAFEGINLEKDFTFTETLPNGRLAIPTDDDNDNEENSGINNLSGEKMLLDGKFCDKYNIQLSLPEKESIFKPDAIDKIHPKKIRMERNSKGKFVRAINVEESDDFVPKEIENETADRINEAQQFLFLQDDINISDIDINGIDLNSGSFNLNEFSFFPEDGDIFAPLNTVINKGHKFFRPYKEYWMYHCIFSRVKGKNFADFERSLPETFRWLLNECALITEMPTEDLYEEVCLIESYHSHTLTTASGNANPPAKHQRNRVSNKW